MTVWARPSCNLQVEEELRKVVDNMLRQELERLQAALDRDRARKGKKAKKASKKKGRRGGKKSKKKKERDLTPDRTLESLFEELVANGIIRKYPEVPLAAFRGERSYGNFALRQLGKDPLPSLGDVRQVGDIETMSIRHRCRLFVIFVVSHVASDSKVVRKSTS